MFETNIVAEEIKAHIVRTKHFFGKVTIFDIIKRDNMLIFPNSFIVKNGLPNILIQPSKKTKEKCDFYTELKSFFF